MAGPGGKEVGRVSIRVVPDTEKFRKRLEKSLKRETRGLEVEIPVKLKGLNKAKAELERLTKDRTIKVRLRTSGDDVNVRDQSAKLKLRPDVDLSGIQSQLNSRRWEIKVGVDLNHAGIEQQLDRMARDRRVRINVDVDDDSLRRLQGALNGVGGAAGGAGKGMGMFSSHIMLVAAAVTLLAPLIAGLVATLVAAIPSLVGVAGGMALVVGLGLDGIKESFDEFTKSIEPLKKHISGWFKVGFDKAFKTIGDGLTGMEDKFHTMGRMTVWIGGLFRTLANTMFEGKGFEYLNHTLNMTTMFLAKMQPVIQQGTMAFLKLASAGSDSFFRLADVIATFVGEFSGWVDRITASGALDKAFEGLQIALNGLSEGFFLLMDAGIQAMAEIGPSVGQFFKSFGEFAKAAMPILSSVLNIILDIASGLMSALAPAFEALQPAFKVFADMISKLVAGYGPKLAELMGSVGEALGGALLSALQALEPVLPVLVETFGEIADIFVDYLAVSGPVIAEIFGKLAEVISEVLVALLPFVPQLLDVAMIFAKEMLPTMPPLIAALADFAMNTLPQVTNALTIILPIVTKFAEILAKVLAWVVRLITWIVEIVAWIGDWSNRLQDLKNGHEEVFNKIKQIWQEIKDTISQKWEEIKTGIQTKMEEIKTTVKTKFEEVKTTLKNMIPDWVQIGIDFVLGLIQGLEQKFKDAWNTVSGWANKLKTAFTNPLSIFSPSRVFMGYGRNIVQGLEIGIDQEKDKPVKKIRNLAEELKTEAEKNFKDLPSSIGQSWANTFASDLGFSSSGAVGTLIGQLMDPQFLKSEQQNIYVVKDLDEAERHANTDKKKKSLQYKNPGMRR